jgi:hypothetical protein
MATVLIAADVLTRGPQPASTPSPVVARPVQDPATNDAPVALKR